MTRSRTSGERWESQTLCGRHVVSCHPCVWWCGARTVAGLERGEGV